MPHSKKDQLSRKAVHKRCEIITGKKVIDADYPGGKSRESWRLHLENGETLIATRRASAFRANLEIKTLGALSKHNAPSPKVITTDDWRVFFQEDIKGSRLSELIVFADESVTEGLLDQSILSLSLAQQAASKESLDLQLPILGAKKDWIVDLLNRPRPLARFFKEPQPVLNLKTLYQLLRVTQPRFVKWDSRPGNAIVQEDGSVVWFDWEHAGARNRLDDLAWLLGDEFVPNYPKAESRLIEKYLPAFADSKNLNDARTYLRAYGTFHMLIRLELILKYKTKGDKQWWDIDYCVEKDKIGITLECATRLCKRAARWAGHSELTQPLVPLLSAVGHKLKDL